ncbi:MAG: AMP-binding protein, partial [Trebonia sp.]
MAFETLLTPERIDRHAGAGYWRNRTITDFLDDYAAATPDKVAFIDSRRQVTYAELRELTDRVARGLLGLGVGPGDVVSYELPNWIEWIAVHYAATRIGAISNPLIPIYREREVAFMAGLARSKVMVVPADFRGFDYPRMVERLRPGLPDLRHVIVVDGKDTPDTIAWDTFVAQARDGEDDPAPLAALRPDPNDVTLLIFTSGTTGEPKGVMHTHNTMVAANDPIPGRLGVGDDSVIHMASTLAHLTGFLYGARLPVQNGATGVLQDVWDPVAFVELVDRHKITYTSAATPFLHDLVNAPNLDTHDLTSLRLFCCMGASIPRSIVRQARAKLPGLTVLGGWGQTEDALVTLG